jgi:hypothetical protein
LKDARDKNDGAAVGEADHTMREEETELEEMQGKKRLGHEIRETIKQSREEVRSMKVVPRG